ncbi:ferredoxin reductase [Nonomuraea endophytica]|uniref:Ferredoxin-NADP reductase n=1 Tax=Nonomuraea endophytica TaxID=714136 RepID=A0A7W8EFQ0_9ACTN|nr:ferredoxin reductase [Nonomuraea endophytica]MBB5076677.1 ferredoxin-NADP reductase [Nonomuraea endophytica]
MTKWQSARLIETRDETPSARTLVFDVPGWPGHLAGQHVDVRLTAEDGYTARRSYSLATTQGVELTVQRLEDGEVSPYLTQVMEPDDQLEIRGPVGGWFVWRPDDPAPVLLVAGGAGIVPLMAMIRTRRVAGVATPFQLIYSLRSPEQLYYADELRKPDPGVEASLVYTRVRNSRLTAADLPGPGPDCFVCGPTGFVEAAADLLVGLGHDPARVKTERFGASS